MDPRRDTIRREQADHRFKGYPAFSSLLSSNRDALVIRKFGSLHVRTILLLQDEITQLEDRLNQIDEEVAEDQQEAHKCHNGSFRGDKVWHQERYEIVNHLAGLLEQYDNLVSSYANMQQRPKASKGAVEDIRKWFTSYPQAITIHERSFLEEDRLEDLVSTTDHVKTPLRRILETSSFFYTSKLFRLNSTKGSEYARKYPTSEVIYYNDSLVERFVRVIILLLGLIMLLVPAWLLNSIESHTERLALITCFIALFAGLLLFTMPPKPFETMVGAVTYGALLMVFMQIDS